MKTITFTFNCTVEFSLWIAKLLGRYLQEYFSLTRSNNAHPRISSVLSERKTTKYQSLTKLQNWIETILVILCWSDVLNKVSPSMTISTNYIPSNCLGLWDQETIFRLLTLENKSQTEIKVYPHGTSHAANATACKISYSDNTYQDYCCVELKILWWWNSPFKTAWNVMIT